MRTDGSSDETSGGSEVAVCFEGRKCRQSADLDVHAAVTDDKMAWGGWSNARSSNILASLRHRPQAKKETMGLLLL